MTLREIYALETLGVPPGRRVSERPLCARFLMCSPVNILKDPPQIATEGLYYMRIHLAMLSHPNTSPVNLGHYITKPTTNCNRRFFNGFVIRKVSRITY